MKTAATVAQWTVRVTGLIQIVLGVLFWTGNAPELIPLHILSGLILVLALWVLAFAGARSGAPAPLVAVAGAWGLLVVILGLTQTQILVGGAPATMRAIARPPCSTTRARSAARSPSAWDATSAPARPPCW